LGCCHPLPACSSEWLGLSFHPVREIVLLRRLPTFRGRLVVSTTGHLPGRSGPVRAGRRACSAERAGKTLRLSQIASLFAKACFFALIVAGLGGCSSVAYAPKTAARAGSVHASTIKQMETSNMDRAAPILIRIYKEESTLEVWKEDRSGKFALLNS